MANNWLGTTEGGEEIYQLAKVWEQYDKDRAMVVTAKDEDDKVISGPYQVNRHWKEYFYVFMNDSSADNDIPRKGAGGPVDLVSAKGFSVKGRQGKIRPNVTWEQVLWVDVIESGIDKGPIWE